MPNILVPEEAVDRIRFAARITGLTESDVIGRAVLVFLAENVPPVEAPRLSDVLTGGRGAPAAPDEGTAPGST